MYTKDQIKGMLITLNKLYPKLPREWTDYIIAEASDLPKLGGYFWVQHHTLKVHFKKYTYSKHLIHEILPIRRNRKDCRYFFIEDRCKVCSQSFRKSEGYWYCKGVSCGEFKTK